jgi:hypothetical protein
MKSVQHFASIATSKKQNGVCGLQVHLVVWCRLMLVVCGSNLHTALQNAGTSKQDRERTAKQRDAVDMHADESPALSCCAAVYYVLDVMWKMCVDAEVCALPPRHCFPSHVYQSSTPITVLIKSTLFSTIAVLLFTTTTTTVCLL